MNPYVYRRKALSLSKVRGASLSELPGLFKSVFTSEISSAIAFAAVVFAATSVGVISFAAQGEMVASLSEPVAQVAHVKKAITPSVLGTEIGVYPEILVTSKGNKVVTIFARPIEYEAGLWRYELNWSRAKKANGSIYVNGSVLEATAAQQGKAKVELKPKTRTKIEFYSQPNKRGTLLVRKYFTTLSAPETEVACTQDAKLCPDGVTYVGRTGPNCEFMACPSTDNTQCQNLWWHDNSTTVCARKQFCGTYMYQGLETFDSEAACKADLPSSTQTTSTLDSIGAFRYLKVNTVVSRSWVAWREIEAYDTAGNKIVPADTTAQYTWRGYPSDGQEHGPKLATDGNVNTVWNAGETASNCNWFGVSASDRAGCAIGGQSAWIQLDFGSVKNVSKIRLLTENSPNPASANHQLLVSSDGQAYTNLHEFKGDIKSNTWLIYPESTPLAICDYAAPPVGCSYVPGPGYNSQTQCGKVLKCDTQSTSTEPVVDGTKSVSVRYIQDNITKSGWVAIREMEFYGPDGAKLTPTNATTNCDWCNYGTAPSYSVGAKGAIDGDTQKVWNAGETADNCSWYTLHTRDDGIYGYGCSSAKLRTAWLQVDFGATVKVSKIRIMVMGDSSDRVDELSGGTDGHTFTAIGTLKATAQSPVKDSQWIEYVVK